MNENFQKIGYLFVLIMFLNSQSATCCKIAKTNFVVMRLLSSGLKKAEVSGSKQKTGLNLCFSN